MTKPSGSSSSSGQLPRPTKRRKVDSGDSVETAEASFVASGSSAVESTKPLAHRLLQTVKDTAASWSRRNVTTIGAVTVKNGAQESGEDSPGQSEKKVRQRNNRDREKTEESTVHGSGRVGRDGHANGHHFPMRALPSDGRTKTASQSKPSPTVASKSQNGKNGYKSASEDEMTLDPPSSSRRRKKHKGWAYLDDELDLPVNNQDTFQQIAEEAAKAAHAEEEQAHDGEPTAPGKGLRAKRERRSTETARQATDSEAAKKVESEERRTSKPAHIQASGGDRHRLATHKASPSTPSKRPQVNAQPSESLKDAPETPSRPGPRSRERRRSLEVVNSLQGELTASQEPHINESATKHKEMFPKEGKGTKVTRSNDPAVVTDFARGSPDPASNAQDLESTFALHSSELQSMCLTNEPAFSFLKSHILRNVTGRRRFRLLPHLAEEYQKVHQLLSQTVLAGEGNSMLVIGSRGSGKSTLVESAISDFGRSNKDDFHVVRLNGFIQTDDRLALREIWRQLGRELDSEQEDAAVRSNYADTLTSLLALLSHQEDPQDNGIDEKPEIAKSVIFVIDEFDLFASHPRQTLLYNLFDVAQSYRNAPVAVLGLTTKINVIDNLEKRVKSRFGQRYVHLPLPKSLQIFKDICLEALTYHPQLPSRSENPAESVPPTMVEKWNAYARALLDHAPLLPQLLHTYHTTKQPTYFQTSHLLPIISALTPSSLTSPFSYLPSPQSAPTPSMSTEASAATAETSIPITPLAPPDSCLHLLPSLSILQLALLVASARLDFILDTDLVSFESAYAEYLSLVSKAKVHAAASTTLTITAAAGTAGGAGRVWSRDVALKQWEGLGRMGLILPAASGSGGSSFLSASASAAGLWRVDVGLDELGAWLEGEGKRGGAVSAAAAALLAKWCREV